MDEKTDRDCLGGRKAFFLGARDSVGLPSFGITAALSGYGVMARDAGLDLTTTFVAVATIWTMPTLMAFTELLSTGTALWAYFITLLVISFRNLPMALSAMPMIRSRPGFHWHQIIMAQLLSPTAWVQITIVGRTFNPPDRMPYYLGFALALLVYGLLGAWIGHFWAAGFHPALGLALLLVTPMFIILTMATTPKRSSLLALAFGCVLVPLLMFYDPNLGLVAGGLIAGTLGFYLGRERRPGPERLS